MEFKALYPELVVKDLDRSMHFYVDVPGFNIEYDRPEERFVVNFSIAAPDVSYMAKVLEAKKYSLRIPVRDQWHRQNQIEHGERQLWVMDPDGYLLRFIEDLGTRKVMH
jgi:catechol 2,3-dioxygenase-like lactoylglutathione lyase family enzyme